MNYLQNCMIAYGDDWGILNFLRILKMYISNI